MQSRNPLIVEPNGLDAEALPKPIDWAAMFGNDHPVEIEIGSGKGTFITGAALGRPGVNFLGVEWARWFWRYTSDRLRRNGCGNARAVRLEAGFLLDAHVPAESVSVLHVYFPDPWPKAKHHRRRLIQPSFMPKVRRALVPGGVIRVVTDHADYWEQIDATVRGAEGFDVIDYEPPGSAGEGEVVGTNFERKYRREGRPFHAIAARKRLATEARRHGEEGEEAES